VAAAALRLGATGGSRSGIANQIAFGLGAGGGLAAGPRAFGRRASRSAVGHSGSANSLALGGQAHILAQGAASCLAVFPRAAHLTLGFLTANITSSLAKLLASQLASGLFALRLAHSWAGGSVTIPLAIREAVSLHSSFCRSAALQLLESGSTSKCHILSHCVGKQNREYNENRLHDVE